MEDIKINHCPNCGQTLGDLRSLQVEYWDSHLTIFFCWCHHCYWKGEVTKVDRVTATEPS